jgi:hypothetical protein
MCEKIIMFKYQLKENKNLLLKKINNKKEKFFLFI